MSTLKVDAIRHNSATSDAITTASDGTCTAKLTSVGGAGLSHRNIVINGAMQVSQRGTSFTNVGAQEYTLDRFITLHSYGGTQMGVSQSSTSPDGFSNSYKLDVNTADTSIGAAEFVFIRHKLEAQDLQQLAYGTSGAKSITLSFYVRSNVTGTYAICLQQKDNGSKQVNGSYTINSANTWERKTFTCAGDTSGVIDNDNGHGLDILWTLVAGSDRTSGSVRSTWTAHANADESVGHTANILSSTSNNFHLTGVQLEVGDTATSFEHRSYGEELARCQRYYEKIPININEIFHFNVNQFGSSGSIRFPFKVSKRAVPSAVSIDAASFDYYKVAGSGSNGQGNFTVNSFTTEAMQIKSAGAAANGVFWCHKTATGYIDASAEL